MICGVIYILVNKAYPGYVKLGYAKDVRQRLKQLNSSSGLLFPFEIFGICEVEKELADKDLHNIIDLLNPDLRVVSQLNGKQRVREFYKMAPDDAYNLLLYISSISGHPERVKHLTPDGNHIVFRDSDDKVCFRDYIINYDFDDVADVNVSVDVDSVDDVQDLPSVIQLYSNSIVNNNVVNAVSVFMDELTTMCPNGLGFKRKVPCRLLYDMFVNWHVSNYKTNPVESVHEFNKLLQDWIGLHSDSWYYVKGAVRCCKSENKDVSVFKLFPASQDWIQLKGDSIIYNPKVDVSKNYIVYVGLRNNISNNISNDISIENI